MGCAAVGVVVASRGVASRGDRLVERRCCCCSCREYWWAGSRWAGLMVGGAAVGVVVDCEGLHCEGTGWWRRGVVVAAVASTDGLVRDGLD